jgi:hypothetical protein
MKKIIKIKLLIMLFTCLNIWQINGYANDISLKEKRKYYLNKTKNETSKIKKYFYKYKRDAVKKVKKVSESHLRKEMFDFIKLCKPNRMVGNKGNITAHRLIKEEIINSQRESKQLFPREGRYRSKLKNSTFKPSYNTAIKFYQNEFKSKVKKMYKGKSKEYKKGKSFTKDIILNLKKLKKTKVIGQNIIWEKKGLVNPKKVLLLIANFDTVGIDKEKLKVKAKMKMEGANNNATGVIALINLIKILESVDLANTVRIAFFDFSEFANLGAHDYAKKLKAEIRNKRIELKGIVNVVMIGHDTKYFDLKKKLGNMKVYTRDKKNIKDYDKDLGLSNLFNKHNRGEVFSVRFSHEANNIDTTDHHKFWSLSVPTLLYSHNFEDDPGNSKNHTEKDFIEGINFRTYKNSFHFISIGVIKWALNYELL